MNKSKFKHIEYKKRNIQIWNEVAPRYHKRWASIDNGPFQSTSKLVKLAGIKKGDKVLDVGCGTGVVVRKIVSKIGSRGFVVGIDTSKEAIKIAKKWNGKKDNIDFIVSDAESFHFDDYFDVITCQYALFFFPDAQKVLRNLIQLEKKGGTLAIAVHGLKTKVRFFSSIVDAVTKFIPDYVPPGSPDLDRFGTKKALSEEVKKAGFSKIRINELNFSYSPGTFEDYWRNYLKYIAKPLKEKLYTLSKKQRSEIKKLAKINTKQYTKKNGKIIFPWQVLILTAKK